MLGESEEEKEAGVRKHKEVVLDSIVIYDLHGTLHSTSPLFPFLLPRGLFPPPLTLGALLYSLALF